MAAKQTAPTPTGDKAVGVNRTRWKNAQTLAAQFGGIVRLGERLGASKQQASHMFGKNPVRNIGTKNARRIEEVCGVAPGWLDMDHTPSASIGSEHPIDAFTRRGALPSSLGQTVRPANSGPTLRQVTFLYDWVREQVPGIDAPSTQVLTGASASMPETLPQPSVGIVDSNIRTLSDDGIYVLEFGGLRVVRRVARQPDGAWSLSAEARGHEPVRIDRRQEESLVVVGKLVGVVRFDGM